MKKLRGQFILFFFLLAVTLGFLLFYSYQQINNEEKHLWANLSENTFNQIQAGISELLTLEDQRSFSEYRYYYIPESQKTGYALNISPLAAPPENNEKGLLGYFQIDPDGTLSTPYLPPQKDQAKLTDLEKRKNLQHQLTQITESFQQDLRADLKKKPLKEPLAKEKIKPVLELATLPSPQSPKESTPALIGTTSDSDLFDQEETAIQEASPEGSGGGFSKERSKKKSLNRKSIYPNPLEKGASNQKQKLDTLTSFKTSANVQTETTDDELKQEVVSNVAQFQAFAGQKTADEFEKNIFADLGANIKNESDSPESMASIFTDPFRARLINQQNIVFYRKVYINQKIHLQGFVMELKPFFKWLMRQSFDNSILPQFALASLNWNEIVLAQSETVLHDPVKNKILFSRSLGYPLNQLTWSVFYSALPSTSSRTLLNILTAFLFFISTFGLFFIYRSAATEVHLSQKRQDFVSAVTHELKTPLTSIRMYSEMLAEGWVSDENKKKEYYTLMTKEGDRLSRLIENVLHLARLEKHNYRYNFTTTSPQKDFENFSHELSALVKSQGFLWQTSHQDNLPEITYDPDAIKQVLFILVDNSIKFSNSAKEKIIKMDLKKEGSHIIWSVTDKGPGVAPGELNRIFNKFYRVENELTRKTKGTGIGLAMAKMIIDGMGAKIEAQNNKDGGLTVRLVF